MKTPAWKTVDCPVCGAPKGEMCLDDVGVPYLDSHELRQDAARERVLWVWAPATWGEAVGYWSAFTPAVVAAAGHSSMAAAQGVFARIGRACVLGLESVGPPEGPPRG